MAGSFDLFRKYQRAMLAGVAILAMLAFFVLPPFLQMAPDAGTIDPFVATWNGGGIREGELRRTAAMGTVVNQFLRDAVRQATGRDPGEVRLLGENAESVVRTLLLAREAEANGIVVGDAAVNRLLAQVTDNRLRAAEIESLIEGRRLGTTSVSTADVFQALRTYIAADQMRQLVANGLGGEPPGARWDIFRRLEQQATVEVVPVVVESFAADVTAPTEAELRALFERRKDFLPVDRSPEPGFMEPHRVSYDWIAARREPLEAAAAKEVTDAQIETYYEANKDRLYRAKPAAAQPAAGQQPPAGGDAAEPVAEAAPATDKPAERPAAPSATPVEQPPATPAPEPAKPESPPATPSADEPKASAPARGGIVAVRFRREADEPAADGSPTQGGDAAAGTDAPAKASGGETASSEPSKQTAEKPAEKPAGENAPPKDAAAGAPAPVEAGKEPPGTAPPADAPKGTPGEGLPGTPPAPGGGAATEFEPLDAVRDDIRKRLAAEVAAQRVDALFKAITADVGGYAKDVARWKSDAADEASRPVPPNPTAIAEKQGLEGGHADKVTVGEAERAGGVGESFLMAQNPGMPMALPQARWSDLFFSIPRLPWRPVETADVRGESRYLSWKTEDAPAFVPEFTAVRADVERAWRIGAARPAARKAAEEIVAKAAGRPLGEAVAELGRAKTDAVVLEPFTWLSRNASFGGPATLSQPDGLEMPGEEFMRAVFALEPGGTAVAFNEPRTVCYAIRLVSFTPPEDDLRKRFLDPTADQRRLEVVADQDRQRAMTRWMEGLEKRVGLVWTQPPEEP